MSYPPTVGELTESGFAFKKEIQRQMGSLDPVIEWCKNELEPSWRWDIIDMSGSNSPGRYAFYFNNEKDFLAFLLKWS
jgi:hypothetical protein